MAIKRPHTVSIRLTVEEYNGLGHRAHERGQSMSDYLRDWFKVGFTMWDQTGHDLAAGKTPAPEWAATKVAGETDTAAGPGRRD